MEESDKVKKLRIVYPINTLDWSHTSWPAKFVQIRWIFNIKYPLTFYSDIDH